MAQAETSKRDLRETLLLDAPVAAERRPQSRWAYPLAGILFVSLFVAYHASVLLIWNTPHKGLTRDFHKTFLKTVKGYEYFRGTRNNQSWAMFAPNPTRTNAFVRVLVTDQNGEVWDFEQDIWEVNRYPYVWYDRGGKVNRRIDGKKTYQRIYGAWVCREWERRKGESAKSVTFIKRWTHVPHPKVVLDKRKQGERWNQWQAPMKQKEQETVTCRTVTHGQLSPELRERYGLPPLEDEKLFRDVKHRTWWDKQERERLRAEKEAEREEIRKQREAARAARLRASAPIPDARGPVREQPAEPEPEPEPEPDPDDESPDQ